MKGFHKLLKKLQIKSKYIYSRIEHDLILAIVPVVLCLILIGLTKYNLLLREEIERSKLRSDIPQSAISLYPSLIRQITPDISAQAAIIVDDESQVVLYAKNPRLRFSMASTTKVMTALTALDHFQKDDVLTVYSANVEGVNVGFDTGEGVFFDDLLYAMLLPSGNDAALAIAQNYPEGERAFVDKMNEKADTLQLTNTHFTDPAGLDDDGNYTTVTDLAHLASIAIKHPTIQRVIATKKKIISSADGSNEYTLFNLNKLLGENGVTGVKTGSTQGAGEVLITSKIDNGKTYILVVMKSSNRFADTNKLLSLVSENVAYFDPMYRILQKERGKL